MAGFKMGDIQDLAEQFLPKNIKRRTVLLTKDKFVSMIAFVSSESGGEILVHDEREPMPKYSAFADGDEAELAFNKALHTSQLRGWRIFHDGEPNFG